jgi:hypothetical protein
MVAVPVEDQAAAVFLEQVGQAADGPEYFSLAVT